MRLQADVVVVGFGAAGACAALEAAETGSDVILLDRFGGGGATALSGGVVYAGGGTRQQREAGVADSADAMYAYLRTEVGDAVSHKTLRDFCDSSVEMMEWLETQGVPFSAALCPDKTSYPTNRHYLYYSGSELAAREVAPPAPRGHRTHGPGTSGRLFYQRLADAVRARGIRVLPQTTAVSLISEEDGRVTGVECRQLHSRLHLWLTRLAAKPYLYVPKLGRLLHKPVAWLEKRYSRPITIVARQGVILAAGGFVNNRNMMRRHAPACRGGLPLGTPADDGSGITLGTTAGAATAHLDRVSVWRFITPPSALLKGILVDRAGRRVCDESLYGAAIGSAIVSKHDGEAWLLVDSKVLQEARQQLRSQTLWFQRIQMWYLLSRDRIQAATLRELAARARIDAETLAATLDTYNTAPVDPMGKDQAFAQPLVQPPFSLIDCSIRPRPAYPAPMLTLGGLVVSEESGQVLRPDGTPIAGLYAAGRTAVGICSNSYLSGLSLADCVYSGRRAGRHAGGASE
ncbi:FAD-binding protein [Allorhizocola rhizosphaerae]|uniref:FAD-binding protein n=1 Tax=Allorhizocola rhizosphaerae TaxID=1872709 RepID=UPI000E3CC1A2|nr:FAD-binding protein [Allorhizocola rhizosphaerae]